MAHPSAASLLGWLSFSCWLFVYSPQIYENYVNQSGEGLSVFFILIWLLGDFANFFGSWKQNLLPTMIGLAFYYTLCDLIILGQIFYYHRVARLNKTPLAVDQIGAEPTETNPLLVSDSSRLPKDLDPVTSSSRGWRSQVFEYASAATFILLFGVACWSVSEHQLLSHNGPQADPVELWNSTAQVVGWISAMCYIGSRIPQIFKNMETKCKGLSMLFFLVGITGNLTYVGSILCTSLEPAHLWINLSWLVGSGGTVFLDLIVLYQFWFYRNERGVGLHVAVSST